MPEWLKSDGLMGYAEALRFMDARVEAIHAGQADDMVWLLEHPPLYTAGTSAKEADLRVAHFPVYRSGRGGQYTYHGPGQRVAYVMMNLKNKGQGPDIKHYVCNLEQWIINALARFGIAGERRAGRIGIWVVTPGGEKKIAAIGVRVRHWITLHGIAVNVGPDLSHFDGIVPCGIADHGVTSMREVLGRDVKMDEVDEALKAAWAEVFEAKRPCAA
jgi:lipoyl(octanoyl) transferase